MINFTEGQRQCPVCLVVLSSAAAAEPRCPICGAPRIGFLDPLRVEQIDFKSGRPVWKTLAPLRYVSDVLKQTVTVPAEFITDLASVPRLLLTWAVAGGRAPRPAVVHDWLYSHPEWNDRSLADAVLREAMLADPMSGTNAATRFAIWAGVRAGGWWAWRQHEQRNAALNPEWTFSVWPKATEAL